MYSAELTCKKCGHKLYLEEPELWRIISIANDLETEIMNEKVCCNLCQEFGPMHLVVKNISIGLQIFEKNISNTPTYGKSPEEEYLKQGKNISKLTNTHNKPTMDNPCIVCCATGQLEVQYKAHKKEGSFKGVLIEECPICEGKGYFK